MYRSTTAINLTIPKLTPSQWPDILGTHVVPNLVEANDIRRVVEQAETDITLLDQEIARIHEVLAHIELRREEMCRYAEEHRGFLAPVRRCPDEILSEIFTFCIPERECFERRDPLLVDQICRRWREVALGTPALWSDITVVHRERKHDAGLQAEREAEMAQEWLQRAGGRPISLELYSSLYSSPVHFIETILPTISPTSNGWQHLRAGLSLHKANRLSLLKGALASLQSLKLDVSTSPNEPICDVFETAPRLYRVELLSGAQWFTLPWEQLTDLSTKTVNSLDDCLTILSDCPNLISCVFEGVIMRGVDPNSRFRQNLLRHSRLRNLKIETHFNPSAFFDCLATPELRAIHLVDKSNHVFHDAIINFLLRSSCTIVKLIWDMDICSIRGVDRVIRIMPGLEELEVTRNCGAQFARQLLLDLTLDTHAHESLYLCLRLHTIRLYSATGFDIPVLLELIRSRRPIRMSRERVIPLRSVTLRTRKTFDRELATHQESLGQLQAFRDDGLDIFIGHKNE
jgi:hypothetical protein